MLEDLQESVLNHVLGIFPVMCDVMSDSEKSAIVSPYELLESSYISVLAGMDKIKVIVFRIQRSQLHRVFRRRRLTL